MIAVLERDFVAGAIRKRAFVLRSLVALSVAAVAAMVYAENPWMRRQDPDGFARLVFTGGSCTLLALLALLTPPAVVGAILEERQRSTLPLVLATPIGPRAFAAAKLVARSLHVLTWALAALPALAGVALFGGIGPGQVEDLVVLAVAVVVEMAAWGVAVSAVAERLPTAVVMAYLLPLLRWTVVSFLAGATVADGPLQERIPDDPEARAALWMALDSTPAGGIWRMAEPSAREGQIRETLASAPQMTFISPATFGARSRLRNPGGVITQRVGVLIPAPTPATPPVFSPPLPLRHPSLVFLACSLVMAAAAVLFAGRRLAREAEPRESRWARWLRGRRGIRRPPDRGNPMAWKEERLLNTAASRPLYYTVLALTASAGILFILLRIAIVLRGNEFFELGIGLAACNAALLGILGAVAGAAAVAHERTTGTLDLLRATPLGPAEILRGKVGGLFRGLAFVSLFPLFHLLVLAVTEVLDPVTALLGVLHAGVALSLGAGLGMLAGIGAASTGAAITRGVGAYGVLLVGLPLGAGIAAEGFGNHDLAEFLVTGCPALGGYFLLEGSALLLHTEEVRAYFGYYRSVGWEGIRDEHDWSLFWAVLHALFAAAWVGIAVRLFTRRLARDREEG